MVQCTNPATLWLKVVSAVIPVSQRENRDLLTTGMRKIPDRLTASGMTVTPSHVILYVVIPVLVTGIHSVGRTAFPQGPP